MFGKDIFWYGVQAVSLVENGKLHSPNTSPVFHIVAVIFKVFGISKNSLLLFQILTAIWLYSAILTARYLLFGQDPKSAFVLPSFIIFVVAFLYPKQCWSLGFLAISIGCYSLTNTMKKWLGVMITFGLAIWFHPMIGILGLGLWILFQVPRAYYILIFALVIILSFLLPKDLDSRFYSGEEIFPVRAAYGIASIAILWEWFVLGFGAGEPKKYRELLAFLGLLSLIPVFHFADIQYRILLSLICLTLLFVKWSNISLGFWFITNMLWSFTIFTQPNLFRYAYENMNFPGQIMAKAPNNGLLIAHHGFCEYYHFQFRKDCLSWKPDDRALRELSSGKIIYRAVYGIRSENLLASRDENKKPIFSSVQSLGDYQLVLESDWNRYVIGLETRNSPYLKLAKSWKNPYRKRPSFLRKTESDGI